MPTVPKIYQYYPDVPLKELTDLYSVGDNRFPDTPASNGNPVITHRVCMLSYFTRTLMIHDGLPFNNKYVLLLENMANVGSITWGFQLYLNGTQAVTGDFIIPNNPTEFEYDLFFMKGILDNNSLPRFDKLKVTCSIVSGTNTIELFVFHELARATNVIDLISETQCLPFAGNPDAFNFIANQLKAYYSDELLTWNNHALEIDAKEDEALKKAVLAVIYYNIQNCRSMTQEMSFLFDLNDFSPLGIKKLINDGNTYQGSFKTGFCQVPLHVLSDILPVVTGIPDYAHIDVGNPVYSIIENNQLNTYNDLESKVLLTIPQKLQQMRDRMTANIPQLTKLYHLSIFPKSAIRMAAMLIKYLFESSKKNSCKECLKKDVRWSTSSLDSLKEYPTFLSNILTHYFREPYNKIEEFAPEAIKATKLTFSPYIYSLIHNVEPRILRAYFASRKVTKTPSGEFWMEFERIGNDMFVNAAGNIVNEQNIELRNIQNQVQLKPDWDSFLGREFLLVVETWGLKGKEITCQIRPSANLFTVGTNNDDLQVQADGSFVTNIMKRTGLFDALHVNTNTLPGSAYTEEYLKVNHSEKTIVKIRLRPNAVDDFNTWTTELGTNPLTLGIIAKCSDGTACLFGTNILQVRANGEFLTANDYYNGTSRFRIVNRNFYEINHSRNDFNLLINSIQANDNLLGRIINPNSTEVVYLYYDINGGEHYLGSCLINSVQRWLRGSKTFSTGWVERVAGSKTRYYNPDGTNQAQLIQVQLPLDYNQSGVIIGLADNTTREYMNPEAYASLLGALAECGFTDVTFNGSTSADGTGAPSISHINGINADFRYLKTNLDGGSILVSSTDLDVARQNQLNNAFHAFGWGRTTNFLSNLTSGGILLDHCNQDADHHDHLHLQGYQSLSIDILQL